MNMKKAIEIVCVGREKLLTVNECHKVVALIKEFKKKCVTNDIRIDDLIKKNKKLRKEIRGLKNRIKEEMGII